MVKFLFFSANLLICLFGGLIFGFSMWANLDKDFAANLEKFARSIHHDNLNVLAKVIVVFSLVFESQTFHLSQLEFLILA